jgi:hypothetical protein
MNNELSLHGNTLSQSNNSINFIDNDNYIGIDGAVCSRHDRVYSDTQSFIEQRSETKLEIIPSIDVNQITNSNIYRYKFTTELTDELFKFSKIHQYDERKAFKEAWDIWIEENTNVVSKEVRRLNELGYDGDVIDKMFKSARYYFRKKSTEKKDPAKRRNYVGVNKDLLEAMDKHIKANIRDENYKPSDGFDKFCKSHIDLLKDEVHSLCQTGMKNSDEIKNKIKKTYKNRYFICTR